MSISSSHMTAEEFFEVAQDLRCELIRGEVVDMSPVGYAHGHHVIEIAMSMRSFGKQHHLGSLTCGEVGFVISRNPDTVLAPDVSFVRASRLPEVLPHSFFDGPPDIAIEVISPSESQRSVDEKTERWLNSGVVAVWNVHPRKQTLVDCRMRSGKVMKQETDALRNDLLPGFTLTKESLFEQAGA